MEDPFNPKFMYNQYQETFTISKQTTLKEFQECVTAFWGLESNLYGLYDENADSLAPGADGFSGFPPQTKMEKVIENLISKDVKFENKEILPSGPRKCMLFIGDNSFEKEFNHMRDLYTATIKYHRDLKKKKE